MRVSRNFLGVLLPGLFGMVVLAACASSAPEPTETPVPSPTPSPTPAAAPAVLIDPETDPDGFLASLPDAEIQCAASAAGSMEVLADFVSLSGGQAPDISDAKLKIMSSCISGDSVEAIVVGQLDLQTGGLSSATEACVRAHTGGLDFGTVFTGRVFDPADVISTLQATFCLSSTERAALESSDFELVNYGALGGIDAIECAVDSAGPNGLAEFSSIFTADGEIDQLAVGSFMPILIECGVVDDSRLEETGITTGQFSCLFERLDSETLDSLLSFTDGASSSPDLSAAAEILAAMGDCGLDLQEILESTGSSLVEPTGVPAPASTPAPPSAQPESTPTSSGTPSTGGSVGNSFEVSSELLLCLTDQGVSAIVVAELAAGMTDSTGGELGSAIEECLAKLATTPGGGEPFVPNEGGAPVFDPAIFDSLPITAEQAQCLVDEIGIEQLQAIAAGTASPLVAIGAISACNIAISDLVPG